MAIVQSDTPEVQVPAEPKTASAEMAAAGPSTNPTPAPVENPMLDTSRAYLGKTQPEDVLQSEDATDEERMAAIQQQAQHEAVKNDRDQSKFQEYQAKLEQVNKFNTAAAVKGYKPMKMPTPEAFGLDAKRIDELSMAGQPQQPAPQQPDPEQQKRDEEAQIKAAAKQQEMSVKTQVAGEMGQQKAIQDLDNEKMKRMDEAIKLIDEKDQMLDKIDPNRFWNSKSTFEKILGSLAVAAGAAGSGNGPNQAYEMIHQAIDNDINAQKLTNENKIAVKANALKRVEAEINRFSEMSKDAKWKAEMKIQAQKLAQDRQALVQNQASQMAIAKAVTSGEGLSREEFEVVANGNSELQNRAVILPNGRVKTAANPEMAKKFQEYTTASTGALDLTRQLKTQAEELTLGDKLSPARLNSLKATTNATAIALVGQLRLPFTGPGILNEQEYERLMTGVVGDPTTLWKRPQVIKDQLGSLENLLNTLQGSQYKAAGVGLNPSAQQMKLKSFMEKQVQNGLSPSEIEKAAKKLGYIK